MLKFKMVAISFVLIVKIPYARGKSRSRKKENILNEIQKIG